MNRHHIVSLVALAAFLLLAGNALAGQSSTTWGNGKTTSSSSSVTANGNGTATRTSSFTGPNGNTGMRTATRGNGMATVTRANGTSRVTTRSR